MDLINLGKGYAKNIEITWEIVIFEKLIQILNSTDVSKFYERLNIVIKGGKKGTYMYLTGKTAKIVAEDGFCSTQEVLSII